MTGLGFALGCRPGIGPVGPTPNPLGGCAPKPWLFLILAALIAVAGPARAVDVSVLSDFESDPCVIKVKELNQSHDLGLPDNVIVGVCDENKGNPEIAWKKLNILYGTPANADSGTGLFSAPGLALVETLIGMLLIDLLMAGDATLIACILRRRPPSAGIAAAALLPATAGALVLRGLVAAALALVLALPGLRLAGGVALVILVMALDRRVRREATLTDAVLPRPRLDGVRPASTPIGTLARLAGADLMANLDNVLALAVLARGGSVALAAGLVIAMPAAAFLGRAVTGLMRKTPGLAAIATAVLVWLAGRAALSDSLVASHLGGPLPLVALAVLAIGLAALPLIIPSRAPSSLEATPPNPQS